MTKEKKTAEKTAAEKEAADQKRAAARKRRETAAKRKLALQMIERLKAEYPDAACSLDYNQAW